VNVTPDSFSDGGRHATPEAAIAHGLRLLAEGADVLDVGGESTRPGARLVPEAKERGRVLPVVEGLLAAGVRVPLSVDTRKATVAAAALAAGATLVNDVSGGTHDPALLETVAAHGAGLVVMHMQGTPATMQEAPAYADVVAEVRAFLQRRAGAPRAAGVDRVWVDPGLGFGKTLEHNLALLGALEDLVGDGHPVLLGASRKAFLGRITGRAVDERVPASLACAAWAFAAGADAVRVHDVAATREHLAMLLAIREARENARRPVAPGG
jgi:dihydropteroate synthase